MLLISYCTVGNKTTIRKGMQKTLTSLPSTCHSRILPQWVGHSRGGHRKDAPWPLPLCAQTSARIRTALRSCKKSEAKIREQISTKKLTPFRLKMAVNLVSETITPTIVFWKETPFANLGSVWKWTY